MNSALSLASLALIPALLTACAATGPVGLPSTPPSGATTITTSVPVLPSGETKQAAPGGTLPYFHNIKHGDVVSSPVRVQMGVLRMGMLPAMANPANIWHLNLLVNTAAVDVNVPVPADANHLRLPPGQAEAVIHLQPGAHTLQLLLSDQNHLPHHPALMSERITILVK